MNVAGAILNSLEENEVDEANDGSFVGETDHHGGVFGRSGFVDFASNFFVGAEFGQDVRNAFAFLGIILLDEFLDSSWIGNDELQGLFDDKAELVEMLRIERVNERNLQSSILEENRQTLIHARSFGGNGLYDLRGQIGIAQRNDACAKMV